MYIEDQVSFREAKPLLERCGLFPVDCADYRVGIWDDMDNLVASGALVGDMLQMIAVDPAFQGEDLAAKVMTALILEAGRRGKSCVYMISKQSSARNFEGLGFRPVEEASSAVLLEWGRPGIDDFCASLKSLAEGSKKTGCIVMNANPFTLGHRYLAEEASKACEKVFILVVEEDKSEFPFEVRYALVKKGTEDLANVTVLPGSRYVISSLTFPAYFLRDAEKAKAESEMDAGLFAHYIAPALGISERFIGTEPLSASTNVYNAALKRLLPENGIEVREVTRLEIEGRPVSASEVRKLLKEGHREEACKLLPSCTADYLNS